MLSKEKLVNKIGLTLLLLMNQYGLLELEKLPLQNKLKKFMLTLEIILKELAKMLVIKPELSMEEV